MKLISDIFLKKAERNGHNITAFKVLRLFKRNTKHKNILIASEMVPANEARS